MARIQKIRTQRYRVAIVGDGQTERIYFSDVRDTDRPEKLAIFPDYPRKMGSYKGVIRRAIELTDDYSSVYALIDMDKIIQDNQLKEYQRDKELAEKKGVVILENNPCFEIWLLMHFCYSSKLFQRCDEVSTELKKKARLPDYEKTEKYLRNARLYHKLKGRITLAMKNSRLLELKREGHDALFPRAQIYLFFEWYFNN